MTDPAQEPEAVAWRWVKSPDVRWTLSFQPNWGEGIKCEPLYTRPVSLDFEAKDAEIARLQCALSFWMPGVDLRLDDATRELAAHDAEMLAGYAGPIDPKCWGDEILERAITAESRISDLERQLAEETERCANKAGEKSAIMPHQNDFTRGYANGRFDAAAAIRGSAK